MPHGDLTYSDRFRVRMYSWSQRAKGVKALNIESLFVGLSLVALYMGAVFMWGRISVSPATFTIIGHDAKCSVGGIMFVAAIVSVIGYLDSRTHAEWVGMLGQFAFWIWTGLVLSSHLPDAPTPKVYIALGLLCAWVSTRMILLEVHKRFGTTERPGGNDTVNIVDTVVIKR